ncbi:MAG: Nre family DNA repair protein [Candidatus Bathyarchaeota archaeon]|nr:Nre family DNA repair protein [Candidatus Bathyarchaeota archaeon]
MQKAYEAVDYIIKTTMAIPSKLRSASESDNWLLKHIRRNNLSVVEDSQIVTRASQRSLCVVCKGSRRLCGKTRCPLMVKVNYFLKSMPLMSTEDITGVSPPSVFIGRIGYPHVYVGPLVPPVHEDTSLFDMPEQWFGRTIDEIVGFRSLLIRGKHRVHVQKFSQAGRIVEQTRELALAEKSVETELNLTKKPRGSLFMDASVQPFGPSAPIRGLHVSNARFDHRIEKAYYDTDLRATQAVLELYDLGVMITKIQKAFSVGAFGIEKNRRLVPTRWSITAVDDIVSKNLVEKVKTYPEIDEYLVYESFYLDNVFQILMIPATWSYESMEAWYPGTIWNLRGRKTALFSDYEGNNGRTTYAEIGGCYYSARLAVCEQLIKERRQATVIVLREARPGYIMPVGVWQVRENVRNAMRNVPKNYNTLNEALNHIASRLQIPLKRWINQSSLLKNILYQRRITDYFKKNST